MNDALNELSAGTPVPRGERRRLRTREAMLDAAERLLATQSLAALRVDDVAAAADVSVGSVYVHFGSKDGLAAAVAERCLDRAALSLAEAYESSESPLGQVAASGTAYMRLLLDHPVLVRYLATDAIAGAAASADDLVAERVTALLEVSAERIEAAVAAGEARPVDARLMARFLFGAWNGVAALTLRGGPGALTGEEAAACLEQARHVVIAGLARVSESR